MRATVQTLGEWQDLARSYVSADVCDADREGWREAKRVILQRVRRPCGTVGCYERRHAATARACRRCRSRLIADDIGRESFVYT